MSSPAHSLIEQSQCATEAKTATNGDGFGIAWYGEREEPGLYRDILPAWSDCNLRSLARQIRSPLFFAHVRAATGSATNRSNCHPFTHGRWSFMHNGQIGDFDTLRRSMEASLSDPLYAARQGQTDSELLFLLALEFGLEADPAGAFERAVAHTLQIAAQKGVQGHVRFTAACSDGQTIWAFRYATDAFAPSLYFAPMAGGYCLVSEPLEDDGTDWQAVAAGCAIVIADEGMSERPFAPLGEAEKKVA